MLRFNNQPHQRKARRFGARVLTIAVVLFMLEPCTAEASQSDQTEQLQTFHQPITIND
jgi:hypothetical protein